MTTLESATRTLASNFDQIAAADTGWFASDSRITRSDLEAIVANPDPSVPQSLRDAAQFLLDSDVSRHFLDVGSGSGKLDGSISRDDIDAAIETIESGAYAAALLDTAAGRGGGWTLFGNARDGNIGSADVEAALLDPGVPAELKDALRLAQLTGEQVDFNALVASLDSDGTAAASALYNAPGFAALPEVDRQLLAGAFVDSGGDDTVSRDALVLIQDPSFQTMSAPQQAAAIAEFALLQTPEYTALSASDQRLVREALGDADRRPGDTGLAASIRTLIESSEFQALDAAAQTAVLSQVRHQPDTVAVGNLDRLIDLDWFQAMPLGEQQQTLKTIAYMSTFDNGGDRTILDNTLEKLLDPSEGYSIEWDQSMGSAAHSNPGTRVVTMGGRDVAQDNQPITPDSMEEWQAVNAVPHEINHAIDDVHVEMNHAYLDKEFQAYVTGIEAQEGRPVTRQEAAAVWQQLLDPTSTNAYGYASWGLQYDAAGNLVADGVGAMEDPVQQQLILDQISEITGVPVTLDTYQAVLGDPSSWNPPEVPGVSATLPDAARPEGNTDNH